MAFEVLFRGENILVTHTFHFLGKAHSAVREEQFQAKEAY